MADTQSQRLDQDVIAYQAFTGLRSDVDPERFDIGDLTVGSNIDIDKSGRIARRAGYTQLIAGASSSVWADDALNLALCVQNAQLLRINSDYSLSALRSGLTAGLPMDFVRINDRVYYGNGAENGVVENGVARTWGLAVPPLPGVSVTVGNLPAGDYHFVMVNFRIDGQESGAQRAGVITVPAGSGLVFSLPVGGSDVATKGIYISTPNGEVLYLALLVSNSATTATYAGDTSEFNLPLVTQFMGPPPAGHLVGYYRSRAFVCKDEVLYPSEGYNYELFDLRNGIQLDGRMTLFAALEEKEQYEDGRKSGLFLGTTRSCGILSGSDPDKFAYVPKTDYGAVQGAVDYVDGSLFGDNSTGAKKLPMWLTTQGICVGLPDLEIRNLTRTKYTFPTGAQGAAIFMAGPNKFIAVTNI